MARFDPATRKRKIRFRRLVLGPIPEAIQKVKVEGDPLGEWLETILPCLPRHDDIVLQRDRGGAFMGTNRHLWKLDLGSRTKERHAKTPLTPMGLHLSLRDENILYFCTARVSGNAYPPDEEIGLYRLNITAKTVETLVTRVPSLPPNRRPHNGNQGTVLLPGETCPLVQAEMSEDNSRPLGLCNDLDVSPDGKAVYFTESLSYEGASIGPEAIRSVLSLEPAAYLWCYDTTTGRVSLVARDYTFLDGILLEPSNDGTIQSIVVAELSTFRLLRLHLRGGKAGRDEVLWENLPGMPDGLARDAKGEVYLALVKGRTRFLTWLHRNPWAKYCIS